MSGENDVYNARERFPISAGDPASEKLSRSIQADGKRLRQYCKSVSFLQYCLSIGWHIVFG